MPRALAIWPATEPTAPAAAETNTVSPGCNEAMSVSPTHAVNPGIPRAPSSADGGTPSSRSTSQCLRRA